MRPWQFSKPKGPGFGISKGFYLSVLSTTPTLPAILSVLNPDGAGGAVEGMGAPLMSNASKDSLSKPMERGAYALATKDKKSVIQLLIVHKDEAGFDSEALARSSLAQALHPEVVNRVRATWNLAQLRFESHHPMVYPSVRFMLRTAARLAELTDGVVADPISQRYLLPNDVIHAETTDEAVDVRDVVAVGTKAREDGVYGYTLGLQKFGLPEFEVSGADPGVESLLTTFLLGVSQAVLAGNLVQSGQKVGSRAVPFEIREGGFDRGMWEGIPVFELLPPTKHTASEALQEWAAEAGSR